jgi:hypothetical protein
MFGGDKTFLQTTKESPVKIIHPFSKGSSQLLQVCINEFSSQNDHIKLVTASVSWLFRLEFETNRPDSGVI